jgi:predicted phosphoribosyltransferase
MSHPPFVDRLDAARQLAGALAHLRDRHPLVLGVPRGAVPMAREIARRLDADFDVLMVRKLGAPGQPELAVGAVDESGHAWIAAHAEAAGADAEWLRATIARERRTMAERRARWGLPDVPLEVRDRTVVVVDDGIATGATLVVALDAVRRRRPARLVCAVPVGAPDSVARVRAHCDELVCLHQPWPFNAVGAFYERFDPVEDDEVLRCLHPPGGRDD